MKKLCIYKIMKKMMMMMMGGNNQRDTVFFVQVIINKVLIIKSVSPYFENVYYGYLQFFSILKTHNN